MANDFVNANTGLSMEEAKKILRQAVFTAKIDTSIPAHIESSRLGGFISIEKVLSQLEDCHDSLPSEFYDFMDLEHGSTYVEAVANIRERITGEYKMWPTD